MMLQVAHQSKVNYGTAPARAVVFMHARVPPHGD
jgi:hypothetical protein